MQGQVVIITGAAGALGRSHAYLFAQHGAYLVLNDINTTRTGGRTEITPNCPLKSLCDDINANYSSKYGCKAVYNYNNVISESQDIINYALDTYDSKIDVLINNAGFLNDITFAKMNNKQWHDIIDVHLNAAYSMSKAVWPIMLKQKSGRIINTTSAAGIHGNYGQSNYSAGKSGLIGFTKTLAIEGGKYGIKVNAIAPVAKSRMTEGVFPEELIAVLQPQYISPVVLYLSSKDCKETGAIIECAGGWIGKSYVYTTNGIVSDAILSVDDQGKVPQGVDLIGAIGKVWENLERPDELPKGAICTSGAESFGHFVNQLEEYKDAQEAKKNGKDVPAKL